MKLLTVICESFNRYDVTVPEGFICFDMDMRPSTKSADALYLMETDQPLESANQKAIFSTPGAFLANEFKTRLVSNFWPAAHDPVWLDPLASRECLEEDRYKRMEPDCGHWKVFVRFLTEEFYASNYRHLIYWPYTGHAGLQLRLPEENRDVPTTCRQTFSHWLNVLKEHVWPLVDWGGTVVLMHPDHGTTRKGMQYENAIWDGFLLVRWPGRSWMIAPDRPLSWADLRDIERHVLRDEAPCAS